MAYVCLRACTCLLRQEVGVRALGAGVQAFVNCWIVGAGLWTPIFRTEQQVVLTAELSLSPSAGFQRVNACILTHCQEGGIITL